MLFRNQNFHCQTMHSNLIYNYQFLLKFESFELLLVTKDLLTFQRKLYQRNTTHRKLESPYLTGNSLFGKFLDFCDYSRTKSKIYWMVKKLLGYLQGFHASEVDFLHMLRLIFCVIREQNQFLSNNHALSRGCEPGKF